MALVWIKSQFTFLSAEVKDLLVKAEPETKLSSAVADYWLTLGYRINWKNVEKTLNGIPEIHGSKCWFRNAVEDIAPLFSHCDQAVKNISSEDYITHLQPYVKWTHQEKVVSDCVKLLRPEKKETDHLLALLMITSLAERALGNLLLTKQKQVPFLLRDLLVTSELQEILGKPKCELLVILLGSVLGLNLRNIAWHGFLSPKESKSAYIATIICILADCGRDIKDTPGLEAHIPGRPQTTFGEAESLNYVFMDMPHTNRPAMEEISSKSPIVPDVMLPVWSQILNLVDEERYGLCLVLLLPMLECSMRCLFAHLNGVSSRVLTAENSTFYTTLDEILKLVIEKGNADTSHPDDVTGCIEGLCATKSCDTCGADAADDIFLHENETEKIENYGHFSTNLVPLVIGRQLNEALHDMLNFVHGPRVRDRMSHGEVELDCVSIGIVYHILYISLLLLSLGNWRSEPEDDNTLYSLFTRTCRSAARTRAACTSCNLPSPNTEGSVFHQMLLPFKATEFSETTEAMIQSMKKCVLSYKCVYHPSAILHKSLMSCIVKLEKWTKWDRVCCNDLDYPNWEIAELIALPKNLSYTLRCHVHRVRGLDEINLFKTAIEDVPYEVLYRTKSELELVSVLSRIVCSVQSALDNTQDSLALKYSQYTDKALRSRQRETYRRQLTAVPTIVLNCFLTCQLVYTLFMSLDILQSDKSQNSNLLKSLKKVLKIHENIVSQTSVNMNRWDEALRNSIDNVSNIGKDFGK